jgi:hypothetical protein
VNRFYSEAGNKYRSEADFYRHRNKEHTLRIAEDSLEAMAELRCQTTTTTNNSMKNIFF